MSISYQFAKDFRAAFTVTEVAHLLGYTPDTIRRWIAEGEMAAREVGGRRLILRSELERVGLFSDDFEESNSSRELAEALAEMEAEAEAAK